LSKKHLNCLPLDAIELVLKTLKDGTVDGFLIQRTADMQTPRAEKINLSTQPITDTKIDSYHFVSSAHRNIVEQLAAKLE
jgi:hypothetical protein